MNEYKSLLWFCSRPSYSQAFCTAPIFNWKRKNTFTTECWDDILRNEVISVEFTQNKQMKGRVWEDGGRSWDGVPAEPRIFPSISTPTVLHESNRDNIYCTHITNTNLLTVDDDGEVGDLLTTHRLTKNLICSHHQIQTSKQGQTLPDVKKYSQICWTSSSVHHRIKFHEFAFWDCLKEPHLGTYEFCSGRIVCEWQGICDQESFSVCVCCYITHSALIIIKHTHTQTLSL